ncbi:MAG TPA: hypothetical protein VNX28_03105, partial [Gemmataceae bacterium]|nr:hypothetical protein [Gemmataceae bacterium]
MTVTRTWRWLSITLCAACLALAAHAVQGQNKGLTPPYKFEIPPAPALSARDEMKTFKIVSGYRVELVAGEPLVHDPVAMTFDPDGRIWVCEMPG